MNINIQTENTKNQIINILNNAEMPISLIYYMMKDLLKDIENQYYNQVAIEQKQAEKEEMKQTENN